MSVRYQSEKCDTYKVGSDYNQDFDRIRQAHKQCSQKFEDHEFPVGHDAIGEIDLMRMGIHVNIFWKRPHEIIQLTCSDPNAKPIFMDPKTATRFAIKQGKLGDCWYLASMSTLTTQKDVFRVVVPQENINGFDDGEYCGAFFFRFWRAGTWLDVIIDDRLPCVEINGQVELLFTGAFNNQFWPALAEKAFAKMYRSYETIEGGYPEEALEDFCGGIAEMVVLKEVPANFRETLVKAYEKKSFIGISSVDEPEEGEPLPEGKVLGDGIVSGHAYSVTRIEEVKDKQGAMHLLLRLRNPWGHGEWTGKWSDGDDASWATVHTDLRRVKNEEGIAGGETDDGEFWISYEDAIAHCDVAHFCHWAPQTLDRFYEGPPLKKTWDIKTFNGQWANTLRGSGEIIDHLEKYPQHRITVEPLKGEPSEKASIVVALMYSDYAKSGPDEVNPLFGFRIFKIPDSGKDKREMFDTKFFKNAAEVTVTGEYEINNYLREINRRFEVEAGDYCIVSCLEIDGSGIPEGTPLVYLSYLLRVFVERIHS